MTGPGLNSQPRHITDCATWPGVGSVVVDSLLYVHVPPIICGGYLFFVFCYALLSELSSFAIILARKRELIILLWLSPWCLVTDCLCRLTPPHNAAG